MRFLAPGAGDGMDACKQAGCDGFNVAFDSTNLPREKDIRMRFQLQRGLQKSWGVYISIAVNLAKAQETGVL